METSQTSDRPQLVDEREATAKLITPGGRVVVVVGNEAVRAGFDANCLRQIATVADAPGVKAAVLNPDGHVGYGCPVGSVFASDELIYPNAVGPDVCCSMSLLQLSLPADRLDDKRLRRAVINAIEERIPLGPGGHRARGAGAIDRGVLRQVPVHGATPEVLAALDIPPEWVGRCEVPSYGDPERLAARLDALGRAAPALLGKLEQLGGVGGGNHFMECSRVDVKPGMEGVADAFGLRDGRVGFLNHFGSRGFGFMLTSGGKGHAGQFKSLYDHFARWHIPLPGGDGHNVYVPVGSSHADDYLADMHLGANFAVVNHLLVCRYVLEAFREAVDAGVYGTLVYHISHNIIREEPVGDSTTFVHRKGATRALPAGHPSLAGTEFADVGHPILLPGNPIDGSTVMVGLPGSALTLNSVNHGAGRRMSRGDARRGLDAKSVTRQMDDADILTNMRRYPVDEASAAYKPYGPVIESVEQAGLARTVATLRPRMLLKDADQSRETSA